MVEVIQTVGWPGVGSTLSLELASVWVALLELALDLSWLLSDILIWVGSGFGVGSGSLSWLLDLELALIWSWALIWVTLSELLLGSSWPLICWPARVTGLELGAELPLIELAWFPSWPGFELFCSELPLDLGAILPELALIWAGSGFELPSLGWLFSFILPLFTYHICFWVNKLCSASSVRSYSCRTLLHLTVTPWSFTICLP